MLLPARGANSSRRNDKKLTKVQEDSSDGCSGVQPSVPLLESGHAGQAFGVERIEEDSPQNVRPLDLSENPAEAEQNQEEVADRSLGPGDQALGVNRTQEVMQQARFRHRREQQGQIQERLPAAEGPAEGRGGTVRGGRRAAFAEISAAPEGSSGTRAQRADLAEVQAEQESRDDGEEHDAQRRRDEVAAHGHAGGHGKHQQQPAVSGGT